MTSRLLSQDPRIGLPSGIAIANRWLVVVNGGMIVDTNGKLLATISTPFTSTPELTKSKVGSVYEFNVYRSGVRRSYYGCGAVGNRIFGLFNGAPDEKGRPPVVDHTYIHDFDWDGKLIRILWIDHRVNAFAFDGDSLFYTAAGWDASEPSIRVTRLPALP